MAITAPDSVTTPNEKPDPKVAGQREPDGVDRAGFDLGGSRDSAGPDATTAPGDARDPVPAGASAGIAGATGMNDGDGRAIGGPAGGLKPGEATQATAGAVRPPQSTSADQTFTQGNPDDAA